MFFPGFSLLLGIFALVASFNASRAEGSKTPTQHAPDYSSISFDRSFKASTVLENELASLSDLPAQLKKYKKKKNKLIVFFNFDGTLAREEYSSKYEYVESSLPFKKHVLEPLQGLGAEVKILSQDDKKGKEYHDKRKAFIESLVLKDKDYLISNDYWAIIHYLDKISVKDNQNGENFNYIVIVVDHHRSGSFANYFSVNNIATKIKMGPEFNARKIKEGSKYSAKRLKRKPFTIKVEVIGFYSKESTDSVTDKN